MEVTCQGKNVHRFLEYCHWDRLRNGICIRLTLRSSALSTPWDTLIPQGGSVSSLPSGWGWHTHSNSLVLATQFFEIQKVEGNSGGQATDFSVRPNGFWCQRRCCLKKEHMLQRHLAPVTRFMSWIRNLLGLCSVLPVLKFILILQVFHKLMLQTGIWRAYHQGVWA